MKRSLVPALVLLFLAALVTVPAKAAPPPTTPPGCDPIDPAACLLPFPNDYFTVPDRSTPTGRRVQLAPEMMPRNVAGVPVDPTE
ncbi:MAG TPA: hypothetical protein VNP92_04165, partial [Actinophytocola sp.]|nr:hypothetical protein [Actinophytocola sp.]